MPTFGDARRVHDRDDDRVNRQSTVGVCCQKKRGHQTLDAERRHRFSGVLASDDYDGRLIGNSKHHTVKMRGAQVGGRHRGMTAYTTKPLGVAAYRIRVIPRQFGTLAGGHHERAPLWSDVGGVGPLPFAAYAVERAICSPKRPDTTVKGRQLPRPTILRRVRTLGGRRSSSRFSPEGRYHHSSGRPVAQDRSGTWAMSFATTCRHSASRSPQAVN